MDHACVFNSFLVYWHVLIDSCPNSMLQPVRSFRRRAVHVFSGCLVFAGVVLHVTVRDRIPFPVAGLYYALPRPMLLLIAVIACATAARGSWWRKLFAGVTMLLIGWIAWCDVGWYSGGRVRPKSRTVIFWNVGRNLTDDVAMVDEFLTESPAMVGLVETGNLTADWLADWQSRQPDYEFFARYPGCLLIVRGRILESGYERLDVNSHAIWADIDWQGTRVRAVVVDIAANPWISRRKPVERLEGFLAKWGDGPLVVMGDFNTPPDSVWLAGFREKFQEVFQAAGWGYGPTWPVPAPVMTLDQVWVNPAFRVQTAGRNTSWRSDHRAVWADLDVPRSSPGK